MAEVGRNPFDVPETPTEIVASYQTVSSSGYFVVTYLGEFIEIREAEYLGARPRAVHPVLGGAILPPIFLRKPAEPVLLSIV